MNILVTGANGQLGNEMQRIVAANPGKVNAYFTDVDTLDITDAVIAGLNEEYIATKSQK